MRIVTIEGRNAGPLTGRGTNTYLLPGRRPTLIDAAEPTTDYADRVAEALERAQPGATLDAVLVTHAHGDHLAGVEVLHHRWPTATFAKLPDRARDGKYGVTWLPLCDREEVPAGDSELRVLHTPGHASDHLCFMDAASGTVFCGDLLVQGSTVIIPASSGGSLSAYLHSLRRLLALEPKRALPGHGPAIDDPPALIRGYLAHRLLRERQILEALADGPATRDAIVGRLYSGLAAQLVPAATENVLAHLVKLQEEGRVGYSGQRSVVSGHERGKNSGQRTAVSGQERGEGGKWYLVS
jgi:glyoxylase-like metal-dependent hydrolase (beta-lactamase superfamily II)